MKRKTHKQSFSLVETAVVLTIIILLLTIAVPNLKGIFGSSALQAGTRQMFGALNQARSNAITSRKNTRIFFPVASSNNGNPAGHTSSGNYETSMSDLDVADYRDQSYIIADWTYDSVTGTPAYRWVARTKWEFLPKGVVFDHNNITINIQPANTNLYFDGTWSASNCVLLVGGNTAFGSTAGVWSNDKVFSFLGAGDCTAGECVSFGNAAVIEFKPSGAMVGLDRSLKLVEGYYRGTGNTVIYTHVNTTGTPALCNPANNPASPCPANYSLFKVDLLTGRIRVLKPGGPEGGC